MYSFCYFLFILLRSICEVEQVAAFHNALKDTHEALRNTEAILKTKASQLRRNRTALQALEDDKKQALADFSKLDLECADLEKAVVAGEELIQSNKMQLEQLAKEITKAEQDLENIQPEYENAVAKLQDLHDQRDTAVKETEALYAKQGRGRMFSTSPGT